MLKLSSIDDKNEPRNADHGRERRKATLLHPAQALDTVSRWALSALLCPSSLTLPVAAALPLRKYTADISFDPSAVLMTMRFV